MLWFRADPPSDAPAAALARGGPRGRAGGHGAGRLRPAERIVNEPGRLGGPAGADRVRGRPVAGPDDTRAALPGFSCAMRRRIAAVERYLKHRPGMIGIVLRDRSTGAVWRNKYAGSQIYMA